MRTGDTRFRIARPGKEDIGRMGNEDIGRAGKEDIACAGNGEMVEPSGIEPPTSALRTRRSPS